MSTDALKDIAEAGKCLAFELPTATAFYLMQFIEPLGDFRFISHDISLPWSVPAWEGTPIGVSSFLVESYFSGLPAIPPRRPCACRFDPSLSSYASSSPS
jgi:hypothetical protein